MTDHALPASADTPAAPPRKVRSRLFLKYAGLFVAVVCVALLTNGIFEIWVSYREHKDALIQIQHEQAESAAAKIGQFIKEIESQVGWTTQLLWSVGSIEQRRFDALRLLRQVPAITELAQVDASGKEQLRVSRLAMDVVASGLDLSNDPKFTEAVKNKIYYGPVYFRRESEPYMTLSLAGTRRDAGVSIAEVNLKLIWDVVSKIKVGERGHAYVVDAKGRLIAHPDISLVLRNTDMTRLAQVKAAQRPQADATTGEIETATDIQGRQVLTAYAPVAPLGWTVFVELPVEEAYQPLITSIQRTALVLLAALCLAALAGIFLARRMVVPIQALRAGAARIGGGDLTQRISIKSGDELEALADQFNDMAGQLQESYAGLEQKVEARTRELSQSLEQQTATSEVLQVISSSPGELEPVFRAMLANATRLCEAKFGLMYLHENGAFRSVALHDLPPEFAKMRQDNPTVRPDSEVPFSRVARTKRVDHVADIRLEQGYIDGFPPLVALADIGGARTLLIVPMLKENELVGTINIYRQEVRPFTDKQIELVTNFAAQAVIAIENTRLLTELRESLQQQTATADVLKVISRSPGDLEPVFHAMLENAVHICDAEFGNLYIYEDEVFRIVAMQNAPPVYRDHWQEDPVADPRKSPLIPLARLVATKAVVHISNLKAERGYIERDPRVVVLVDSAGARTMLLVPMLKDGALAGTIVIYRQEERPFSDKQIALLENFAAQAVIAIENTRLLSELRESLEQQTAISDILRVISSSRSDVKPVLDTVAERAAHICEALVVDIVIVEDGKLIMGGGFGDLGRPTGEAVPLDRSTVMGRSICDQEPVHIADLQTAGDEFALGRELAKKYGHHTILAVPLLREGKALGTILVRRAEVRPFEEKHIALLKTFADQAAIAIENTRLLNELHKRTDDLFESLQQQTATAEILRVISNSLNDTQPVFDAIVQSGLRLFPDAAIFVALPEIGMLHAAALAEADSIRAEAWSQRFPFPLTRDYMHSVAILDRRIVDIPDVSNAPPEFAIGARNFLASGYRAVTIMPMVRDEMAIGTLSVVRLVPGPLTDKEISILTTFAAQAVIAIENTRLLKELRQRTDDLGESLKQQTATADVLKVISRSAFDLQTVLDTLVASAARLCAADKGVIFQLHGDEYRLAANYGFSPEAEAFARDHPLKPGKGSATGRVALTGKLVHIPDVLADPDYQQPGYQQTFGYRTNLGVPMLREGVTIGVFVLTRDEVNPFSESQIDLVSTFTDQAVIAMENVRLFNEIQDKSRQLAEASKHKSQFLANMSHELRTPMNAILGYTELIMDNIYGEPNEKMRGVLTRVQSNGKHLLGLINDVLDLSKIEAGQLSLTLADFSVKDVVHSVFSSVESLAKNKKLALNVELPQKIPAAHGDERRLTQVLLNLVGNSLKFTDKGEVTIKAEAANGSFTIAVRDTGPGIAEEDQRKIFEEFQQADSSTTKEKGGTGLGLAISKRIVEMHGGRLWVESQLGHGSTFSFSIPLNVQRQVEPA